MGSAVHAESLRRDGIPLRAMIALEMIGYFQDAPRTRTFPFPALAWLYLSTGNFVAAVGNLGQLRLARRVKGAMRTAGRLPVWPRAIRP